MILTLLLFLETPNSAPLCKSSSCILPLCGTPPAVVAAAAVEELEEGVEECDDESSVAVVVVVVVKRLDIREARLIAPDVFPLLFSPAYLGVYILFSSSRGARNFRL